MKKIFSIVLLAACALTFNSCVKDEVYPYATISGVSNTVAFSAADEVTVEAKVSALVEVEKVVLNYATDGLNFQEVAMKLNGKKYVGTIPAFAKGTEVTYFVAATTVSGKTTASNKVAYEVGKAPVDYKGLVLNELNGNDKFIELYNGGDHDIFLGGVMLFKDGGTDAIWTGPEVNLKKGEYLVLWTTGTPDIDPAYIFNSGLSAKKAVRITLTKPEGETIDDFNTSNTVAWAGSMGRNADGKWYYQETKTPGAKNVDGAELLPML